MYHFIINPTASSGKGLHIWEQVEETLKREGITYEAHILHNVAETTELVRKLTARRILAKQMDGLHNIKETAATEEEQDCHLVVLGGDGTLNAVLNGIDDFEHTVLSCIRTGSGNDFARNMRIDKNVEQALHGILHHRQEVILDYGEITYRIEQDTGKNAPLSQTRRFIISSGVGYDADICEEVSRSRLKKALNKIHLGKLVYVAIGVKQIFTKKAADAILYMDDREPVSVPNLFFVVGMIHEREGGGVPFCPHADATDGKLSVCLVRGMSKWKLLLAVALVYVKKHLLFQEITEYTCERMSVKTESPQWFHMDGETPCKITEASWECKTGLRFLM
ncbi:MAG: diacylglycerol/lipid kinase family protein [Lachnospiraceae bacterium]